MRTLALTSTLALSLLGGCDEPDRSARAPSSESDEDPTDEDSTGEAVELDEDEIIERALAFETELVPMTDEREPSSTHIGGAEVLVWGPEEVKAAYNSIDPDDPTQFVAFPEGTLFVKQGFDTEGNRVGLAVMYKGPQGYFPASQDWFWATYNLETDAVVRSGREQFCVDCHEAAFNTDLVVGFAKSL